MNTIERIANNVSKLTETINARKTALTKFLQNTNKNYKVEYDMRSNGFFASTDESLLKNGGWSSYYFVAESLQELKNQALEDQPLGDRAIEINGGFWIERVQ